MSLGVVIKGPEGIVLAADSRVTLIAKKKDGPEIKINFDNATKLLTFGEENFGEEHNFVAAVTYGTAVIGLRTAYSYIPEIERELPADRTTVEEYSNIISKFFLKQWKSVYKDKPQNAPMVFIIGGYDPDSPYGRVFVVEIPTNPKPIERNPGDNGFGMTWGGQLELATRLVQGFDPRLPAILQKEFDLKDEEVNKLMLKMKDELQFNFPYQILPLQDCVDLATLLLKTTMKAQNLSVTDRGVGGPIEVATITRLKGLKFIQKKSVRINNE